MDRERLLELHKTVIRARKMELDILDLQENEVSLKKRIEELEQDVKPKKRFFRFGKKEQDDYEISQAKSQYEIAVQDISHIQELICVKSGELSSLQDEKEEFTKIFEKNWLSLGLLESEGKNFSHWKLLI